MKQSTVVVVAVFMQLLLVGCDRRIQQTVVVRTDVPNANMQSLWLAEAESCSANRIDAGWYRDGLWIFRVTTTRGGVGTVTQELALCVNGGASDATRVWHSVHGGGAPLLVLSCVLGEKSPCQMYQDGYTEGAWSEDVE